MPDPRHVQSSSLPRDYIRDALAAIGAAELAVGIRAPEKVRITSELSDLEFGRIRRVK